MRKNLGMSIALLLAGLLAVPAAASAAGTIVGGTLKVRDYKLTLVANNQGKKDSVAVMFTRVAAKSTQQHLYIFDKGVKVTGNAISGSLGRYGSINLRLQNTRSLKKNKVPKGCTGKPGKARAGTLVGKFRLVADKTYFRTVTASQMPGTASSTGAFSCGGGGSAGGGGDGAGGGDATQGPMLMHSAVSGGANFVFTATPGVQSALQIDDVKATAPARIMHMITAVGPGLAIAPGGATATVDGLPRFLAGKGTFSGEAAGTVVVGTLAGNLVAKFDSIKPVAIAGDATLISPF